MIIKQVGSILTQTATSPQTQLVSGESPGEVNPNIKLGNSDWEPDERDPGVDQGEVSEPQQLGDQNLSTGKHN